MDSHIFYKYGAKNFRGMKEVIYYDQQRDEEF